MIGLCKHWEAILEAKELVLALFGLSLSKYARFTHLTKYRIQQLYRDTVILCQVIHVAMTR